MISQLISAASAKIVAVIASTGYWGIGIGMAIESCNIPLPSEAILPFGGYLVSTGQLSFVWAVMAGTIGGLIGSLASYYLGYYGGRAFLERYGHRIGLPRQRLALADKWFEKYGNATVFFTRLLPGIRTFISLPAGAARMNVLHFAAYTFAGSLIWSIFLTYIGHKMGDNWEIISTLFHKADALVIVGLLLVIACFVWRRMRGRLYAK